MKGDVPCIIEIDFTDKYGGPALLSKTGVKGAFYSAINNNGMLGEKIPYVDVERAQKLSEQGKYSDAYFILTKYL